MAGRTTFKGGPHPTRAGAIVGPVGDARCELIDECRHLRAIASAGAHMQDVHRTLAAMSRLDGAVLAQAMNDCDEFTAGLLRLARYRNRAAPLQDLPAIAAALAQSDAGGRPRKEYLRHAARRALGLWLALGETDTALWDAPEGRSRFLAFAIELFSEIEGRDFEPKQALRLMRDAMRSREGFYP